MLINKYGCQNGYFAMQVLTGRAGLCSGETLPFFYLFVEIWIILIIIYSY